MRTRASKTASKMRCTCSLSWGRPARSYLMGVRAVPSGRCGCLLHTSMGVFLIEICGTSHWTRTRIHGGANGARARRCYTIPLVVSQASRSPSAQQSDVGRCTRAHIHCPNALGRSGLRNWSECTITFVCAVSEVIRSSKTCIYPQRRLIRSKKQRMTSLWKMTQISKLKAGSLVMRWPS